jgi:hypothetical protein
MEKQFVIEQLQPVLVSDSSVNSQALSAEASTPAQVSARFSSISYNKGLGFVISRNQGVKMGFRWQRNPNGGSLLGRRRVQKWYSQIFGRQVSWVVAFDKKIKMFSLIANLDRLRLQTCGVL